MKSKNCPVCNSLKNTVLLNRKKVSVFQNRLFNSRESARNCQKGDLEILVCEDCGFVFNVSFDKSIDLYDQNYNNTQEISELFKKYLDSSINYLISGGGYDAHPSKVIEIGCGRYAEYLKLIAKALKDTPQIIGYDPASNNNSNETIKIFPRYFDFEHEECSDMDWLISRHVVEHLSNPMSLFKNVYGLNPNNEKSVAFFETPDACWILKNNVIFDFFYEHCSLFSSASILKIGQLLNIEICELKNVFNGQYMWIFLKNRSSISKNYSFNRELENVLQLAASYKQHESVIFEKIAQLLEKKRLNGNIAIWGAGAKGNTFLNLFDKEQTIINCVVDINPQKWGKFISGTGHEIISPENLIKRKINTVIVMNSNYFQEIKNLIGYEELIVIDKLIAE